MQIYNAANVESDLHFNSILSYSLSFSADIVNSGSYQIPSSQFYYRITAVSDQSSHCQWEIVNSTLLSLIQAADSLKPFSGSKISAAFQFSVDECACATNVQLTYFPLRFELYQNSDWNAANYASSSSDVIVVIDCSFFPVLPALAFYVRPYVLEVPQWCANHQEIQQCTSSQTTSLDLAIDSGWYVYTRTSLALGDVSNPPEQYRNVDLSFFPLPIHSFYLNPSKEGANKVDPLKVDATKQNPNEEFIWSDNAVTFE